MKIVYCVSMQTVYKIMLKNTAIKDAQFQSAVMCTVLCLDVLTTANNSLLFL